MNIPDKIKAIDLPKPHGFLVWKGKQTCLISKDKILSSEPVAIVSDGDLYGLAQLEEAFEIDKEFLADNFNAHRLKVYEIPEDEKLYAHNIISFEPLKESIPAKVKDGFLVLEESPKLTTEGIHILEMAKELPANITIQSDYIAIDEKDNIISKFPIGNELLEILNKNFDRQFNLTDKFTDVPICNLYDLVLARNPNMRFKLMEPPNLQMADSESIACKNCKNWNNGMCELYQYATDSNQVCDTFTPRHSGTVIMLPIPIEIGNYLSLAEKDIPMGSKLVMPDDMHITLYYDKEIEAINLLDMPQLLDYIANEIKPPEVNINGIAKFEAVENGEYDALVVGVTSPEITTVRNWIMSYMGKDLAERFSPHITLAYVPVGTQIPNINYNRETFSIPNIALNAGGTRMFETNFRGMPLAEEMEAKQMPYEMIEMNGQYCVRKIGEDKPMECYDTESEAEDYLAALRINVEGEEGKKQWDGSPSNYVDTDAYCNACLIDLNAAAGNDEKIQNLCMLPVKASGSNSIDAEGLQAAAGGRGISRIKKPDGVSQDDFNKARQAAANKIISEYPKQLDKNAPPSVYEIAGKTPPEKAKEGRRLKTEWLKKLEDFGELIQNMLRWAKREDEDDMKMIGFAIKEVNGEPYFYTFSSNAFEDRDMEIIETKALEAYVLKNSENEIKGYFNLWHIPGTDFAQKVWQGVIGRILVEAGPFLKNKNGRRALKFFKRHQKSHPVFAPEGWGASIEFKYLPEQKPEGIYKWLWITRTSVLPLAKAANINTKGELKMLTEEQRELGKQMFGEEHFTEIEDYANNLTKQLEKTTRYKEVDDEEEETENEDTEVTSENVETEEQQENEDTENSEQEEVTEQSETETEESEQVENQNNDEVVGEVETSQPDTEIIVEQVAERVTEGLKSDLQQVIELISTFPDELKKVSNRLSQLEEKAKVDSALKPRGWSLFGNQLANSVTQAKKNEGKVATNDEVEAAKPPEAKVKEREDSYGEPFFNH